MANQRKEIKYRQSNLVSLLAFVAVLFVCVVCVAHGLKMYNKSRVLGETVVACEKEVEIAKQEQEKLNALEQYMQTNAYIEDVAKAKLGLVYPNEIIIKPAE